MSYTTVDELKAYLAIGETGDDPLLMSLVRSAEAAINRYTGRLFEVEADTTRGIDARGPHLDGRTLYLPDDLCAVTAVTNGDGQAVSDAAYQALPAPVSTDVNSPAYAPFHAIRLLSSAAVDWTCAGAWEGAIQIAGRWGYSVQPPEDIRQAARRLAAYYYRQKDAPLFDTTVIEAGVVARPVPLPLDVRFILDRFRAAVPRIA